jgi:hypothetical protein
MATAKKKTTETTEYKRYRLTHLMNVRKAPSMDAPVAKTLAPGFKVTAMLSNDWLALKDGGYVLFGKGQYAQEID